MPAQSAETAADPALVPGIYNYCDQWCSYCQATERCLVHRMARERRKRTGSSQFANVAEAVAFTREVARAAGASAPGLDALLSSGRFRDAKIPAIDEPLERLAREYAGEASGFIWASGWTPPPEEGWPLPQPRPMDVVAWYHVLIAMRVYRAFMSTALSVREPELLSDAQGSAKVALVGIERSRTALRRMDPAGADEQVRALAGLLDRLEVMLNERFPEARGFERPGLDAPVV